MKRIGLGLFKALRITLQKIDSVLFVAIPQAGENLTRTILHLLEFTTPLIIREVGKNIRSRLGAGLLVSIPLGLTIIVLWYVFITLDSLLRPSLARLLGWDFPGIGLTIGLVFLYLIGMLASSNRGSRFLNPGLAFTERIPLVRTIYKAARDVTKIFSREKGEDNRRVVLLDFPRPGVKAIGLVTANFVGPDQIPKVVVYIPTTPNPTSGQLALIPETEVEDVGLSVEEAMRIIISGGILTPSTVGPDTNIKGEPAQEKLPLGENTGLESP
jgi:uncharacterized membrane protein